MFTWSPHLPFSKRGRYIAQGRRRWARFSRLKPTLARAARDFQNSWIDLLRRLLFHRLRFFQLRLRLLPDSFRLREFLLRRLYLPLRLPPRLLRVRLLCQGYAELLLSGVGGASLLRPHWELQLRSRMLCSFRQELQLQIWGAGALLGGGWCPHEDGAAAQVGVAGGAPARRRSR